VLETVCGNGVVEGAEQCDDSGYTGPCDECSPTCQLNPAVCGNGIVEPGEECDDGPTEPDMCTPPVSGDGCDANCQRENFCGDGEVAGLEECDEGAANSNQPDATCRTDCTDAGCGDGILDSGEECDDGNDVPDDRCSNACIDLRTCGDGIVDADLDEECDDGNNVSGDGCSSACLDETVECGDGVKHFTEQCDDGNNVSGDGCSATCMLEGDFCGDGIVGSAEDCDNGGQCSGGSNDGQGCSGPAGCPGGGTCVHQESNDCRQDCSAPFCGDGILDEQLGEQCDPPGGCSCDDNCQVTIC
jgi:cysteine-rich repeat protein